MFHGARSMRFATVRVAAATLVIGLATFVTVLPAQVAGAADDVVSTCAGSGPGSLPAVVGAANSADTITFSVDCPASSPITLASTIDIGVNLTIDGPGASDVAVSGNNTVGVFNVSPDTTVTMTGLTIEDGYATGGGGIWNDGILSVTDSTLAGNKATFQGGAGIVNDRTLTVTDSILSNNTDDGGGDGGGIANGYTTMATISNSTLLGNSASEGGGIYNQEGMVTVRDSTLSDNVGSLGGGIYTQEGTVSVTDSTLSGNSVSTEGGGVYNTSTGGTLNITDSTLSGNIDTNAGDGGGIEGPATLAGTIVANSTGGDCGTPPITDAGYNLDDDGSCGFSAANGSESDVDPDLGPLQDNGGPTETQAPALGSPVLNRIPLATTGNGMTLCPGTDQRGVPRPQGSECDIGAVELVIPKAITSPNSATTTAGSHFSFPVTTSGSPMPKITEKGALPKRLTFTDNADGTATISGKTKMTGVYHLTITATFGKSTNKYVVSQAFTLTVDSG